MSAGDWWYLGLLGAVGAWRLVEMRISRAHQRALAARGFARGRDPVFPLMVALHAAVLVGAAVEVVVARRRVVMPLALGSLAVFVAANALRLWVIRTMSVHWNVRVVGSLPLGVVASGPFRWVRHPNYVAVFAELLALPLVHGAYVTALGGATLHAAVLARRIADEERVLLSDPSYRQVMGGKPRFFPRLRSAGAPAASEIGTPSA